MAHFATLKDIKIDVKVTISLHNDTHETGLPAFFNAVGRFVENWEEYLYDWKLVPSCSDYDEPIIKFVAFAENAPALSFGPEVSKFMRGAENWERWKNSADTWKFTNWDDLREEMVNYFFNEFAELCGYANVEELGFDDTGFEVECGFPGISLMEGYVPIADE